jgi:hypothetical protein
MILITHFAKKNLYHSKLENCGISFSGPDWQLLQFLQQVFQP